ncbi:MAG TPA: hypothetical protein VIM07_13450 [Chitinophagaceae bacterium]
MNEIIVPVIGYAASILLAISLLVTNDLKFRWLNTWGCISFIVYGIFIHALPIILTNSILFLINLFYLIKIYNAKEDFELIEFKGGEKLTYKFLSFYKEDIAKYFPDYVHDENENKLKFVVLRDLVIANIFIAALDNNGNAFVELNYTVPKYRDYKVGEFIFNSEQKFLISKGVRSLVYKVVSNKNHERFIKVMGFKKTSEAPSYIKHIGEETPGIN